MQKLVFDLKYTISSLAVALKEVEGKKVDTNAS